MTDDEYNHAKRSVISARHPTSIHASSAIYEAGDKVAETLHGAVQREQPAPQILEY
jgi:hypothetical protein